MTRVPAETILRSLVATAGTPIVCVDADRRITLFNPAAERAFGRPEAAVIGHPYEDLLPDGVRNKVRSDLMRVLGGQPIAHFENVIERPDGQRTVLLWNITRLPDEGSGSPGVVAVGQDITTMQRMHERLIRQARHLLGLARIDRAIIALQPPAAIAAAAVEHLERIVDCDGAAVVGFEPGNGRAVRLAVHGRIGQILRRAAAERCRHRHSLLAGGNGGPLVVPLVANNVRLGMLMLSCPGGAQSVTLGAIESIGQVADRLAVALNNARLFAAERKAREQFQAASARLVEVQEIERRRIARELHDDIGQGLTGLKLDLEMQSRAGGPPDLENAVAMVHSLIARVRDLSLDLRPTLLDDLGLVPALIALVERYSTQTGIQVTFDHRHAAGRFASDVETAAFRIVQEALTNVARHANVGRAHVRLRADDAHLEIVIEDRGRGFDSSAQMASASTGLSSMRERAAMLGGAVVVESTLGAGTTIRATLPADGAVAPNRAGSRTRQRRTPAQ
jgi:PAS domain S-box-containing protein